MSPIPKYDPNNELFVRREDFDRVFAKTVLKATFHRWVAEGKIKKARDLDGWHLLNKTLVHQGMEPVDVTEFRKERQAVPAGLRNSQLLYLAVILSDLVIRSVDTEVIPNRPLWHEPLHRVLCGACRTPLQRH